MTSSVSKGKKKKRNRFSTISTNNSFKPFSENKGDEEYGCMQQQKLPTSSEFITPDQYIELLQSDMHTAIDKILSKYPKQIINWHWTKERFEPVINDDVNRQNINNSATDPSTQYRLLRMNGRCIPKCNDCFRKSIKREFIGRKEISFLIKYALKFFIEYRGEYDHKCSWKQKCDKLDQLGIQYLLNHIERLQNDRIEIENKYKLLQNKNLKLKANIRKLKETIRQKDEIISKYSDSPSILSSINDISSSIPSLNDYVVSNHTPNINNNISVSSKCPPNLSPIMDCNVNNIANDDEDDTYYKELIARLYDFNQNTQYDSVDEQSQENAGKPSSILDVLMHESGNNYLVQKNRSNSYRSNLFQQLARFDTMSMNDITRKRTKSNSLLPVNGVAELREEEETILQHEFDLFRLLIDDGTATIKRKRRASIINNAHLGIDALINHVTSPQFDLSTLCIFLPLILFKLSKYEASRTKINSSSIQILISKLSIADQLWENDDIRQRLQLLSWSFSKSTMNNPIKNIFDQANTIWIQKCTAKLLSNSTTSQKLTGKFCDISSNHSNPKLAGDDVIKFWENIMNLKENSTEYINHSDLSKHYSFNYRDPMTPGLPPLRKVKVYKRLKSATKPLLCELSVDNEQKRMDHIEEIKENKGTRNNHNNSKLVLSSHIILKRGDLRIDYAIMNVFRFMNYIWKKERCNINKGGFENLSFEKSIVKILTFNVISFTEEFGAIELITNCVPLRHIGHLKKDMKNEHFQQLLTSAAAAYIGSFVCGVRDRHFENILIRIADCTLFHIDFGYCFGDKIKFSLDASPFGITADLKNLINTNNNNNLYENKFIPICVDAYMALRKNYKSLIKFAQLAFSYIKNENDIDNFLKKRLKIFDDGIKAEKWITKQLMEAPNDSQTMRKNKLRKLLSCSDTKEPMQPKQDNISHSVPNKRSSTNQFNSCTNIISSYQQRLTISTEDPTFETPSNPKNKVLSK